ncbi:MAG: 5-oxoprolinase subunit PxpB [bacterium]
MKNPTTRRQSHSNASVDRQAQRIAIFALGDAAVLVRLGTSIDRVSHGRALALARAAGDIHGVENALASYAAVTVYYNPERIGVRTLTQALRMRAKTGTTSRSTGQTIEIPVVYDGPDLKSVAEQVGHSVADVIRIHSEPTYDVFLIGFSPGLPYLGPLPSELQLPRRAEPRSRVEAGSVAIGSNQTTIYTYPTPGGFHVLGRTPARLFHPDATPPALLKAGDRVRFVPSTT